MTHVISIINNKGGVGKTTSTLNLGVALSKLNKKVLLVDLDPQGNLTTNIIYGFKENELTIKELLESVINTNPIDINTVLKTNVLENIDLLPSNILLNGVEASLLNADFKEMILTQALKPIINNYDYILIDNPPSLNMLVTNSLYASNEVIIPIATEFNSVMGTKAVISTISKIKQSKNMYNLGDLKLKGALVTMYTEQTQSSINLKNVIKQQFNTYCFNTMIRKNIDLEYATQQHKDIINYNPRCNGALDYMALAQEIINQDENIGGIN